jgi:Transposase DDE domain
VDGGAALDHWQTFGSGVQARYRDAAIQTTLMVRTAFSLALRQAEGLMASVITLMNLTISAPDRTTISRRAVTLPVIQAASVPHGPLHLLIDSGPMAGGETRREVAPEMAQTASGGRCR